MTGIWYAIISVMLSVYVVLDGFDLGVGALHLYIARNNQERRAVLTSIGPVWDGNEVWLVASGGALFCAFPSAYAAGFSGFYLPLMMVLWLILLRGLAIELRSHVEHPLWADLWDNVFSLASAVLATVLGAALGNILRGVPLDETGYFSAPLFTNFRTGERPGVLDWYTILLAIFALATLTLHGAAWIISKVDGPVEERARKISKPLFATVLILGLASIVSTHQLQPSLFSNLVSRPWSWPLPIGAIAGLVLIARGAFVRRANVPAWTTFAGSFLFILATLAATAAGMFPLLLRSTISPAFDATAMSSAAPTTGLRIAFTWWLVGFPIAVGYMLYLYRSTRGRIQS